MKFTITPTLFIALAALDPLEFVYTERNFVRPIV